MAAAASAKQRRVRLLSGRVVYEGYPTQMKELQVEAARVLGVDVGEVLLLCSGGAVLHDLEKDEVELTAVHDPVVGLLEEYLRMCRSCVDDVPERLWPAREHKGLMLAAVRQNPLALRHAAPELRADRDVVLAAVSLQNRYTAPLQYASPELRADREVVLASVASCGHSLKYASPELRADREVSLAALRSSPHAWNYSLCTEALELFPVRALHRGDRALPGTRTSEAA
jgi:hypothetical protein